MQMAYQRRSYWNSGGSTSAGAVTMAIIPSDIEAQDYECAVLRTLWSYA